MQQQASSGIVMAVSRNATHTFSKPICDSIQLLAGLGVARDAHLGNTVQHRSRVARDPRQPNLRQVHLIHAELHDTLQAQGFRVAAGDMGENITTRGIDLLGLPPARDCISARRWWSRSLACAIRAPSSTAFSRA